jgi:iron(III) transport system substrate-binding protein
MAEVSGSARGLLVGVVAVMIALGAGAGGGEASEVVVYSARSHYGQEPAIEAFTRKTGIQVKIFGGNSSELFERLRAEGDKTPADVLITVDAGRLWRAEQLGFFQPVKSALLDARIPASLREPGGLWFGFSLRARLIAYNKAKVKPAEVPAYESLAEPQWKGRICMRSSTNIYNLSLMGAMIDHLGEQKAGQWAQAIKANLARDPRGGDTDQLKSVAAGECDVTLTNQYYYARLMRSDKPEEREIAGRIGVVFPNQASWGTHINISGAGVMKHAPHRQAAVKFLEYLAGDGAQRYFADGNNEWPVVAGVKPGNPVLKMFGAFKQDALNVAALGRNQPGAQKIYDRVAWK